MRFKCPMARATIEDVADKAGVSVATVDRVLLIHGGRLMFDGSPAAFAEEGSIEDEFWRLTHAAEARD